MKLGARSWEPENHNLEIQGRRTLGRSRRFLLSQDVDPIILCFIGLSVKKPAYAFWIQYKNEYLFPDRHEVESYIKAKYVDRRFVRRPSDEQLRTKVVSLSKQEKRLSSGSEHLPPRPPPPTPKLRPGSNVSGQSGGWMDVLCQPFLFFGVLQQFPSLKLCVGDKMQRGLKAWSFCFISFYCVQKAKPASFVICDYSFFFNRMG